MSSVTVSCGLEQVGQRYTLSGEMARHYTPSKHLHVNRTQLRRDPKHWVTVAVLNMALDVADEPLSKYPCFETQIDYRH